MRHANRILIEGDPPAPAPERTDRWISRTATATVAGHTRQLAAAHGDTGWQADAFPSLR